MKAIFEIKNDLKEIGALINSVNQLLVDWKVESQSSYDLLLAVDEMVSNVIYYAYPQNETNNIKIEFSKTDKELTLKIIDWGKAYNPLTLPPPDTSLSIEKRKVGGLGIHIIKNTMDFYNYNYSDKMNILTLGKKLK